MAPYDIAVSVPPGIDPAPYVAAGATCGGAMTIGPKRVPPVGQLEDSDHPPRVMQSWTNESLFTTDGARVNG
jgi:hypothetical protein